MGKREFKICKAKSEPSLVNENTLFSDMFRQKSASVQLLDDESNRHCEPLTNGASVQLCRHKAGH